jgi:nicotinamide-nucleotide amidase
MAPEIELITTGAELLNGSTVNRHAQWLGHALEQRGWRLLRDTTVPDDTAAIADALRGALSRCDVVLVSGGLGPTSDDVTRDVVAAWAGAKIVMHEPTRLQVVEIYRTRNKPLNSMVERHALVVEGARVLVNHHGLAPGEHIQKNDKHAILLPGPPREFQGILHDHIFPWLDGMNMGCHSRRQWFQTAGLGESDIAALLNAGGLAELKVDMAYCAKPSQVSLRVQEIAGHPHDYDRALSLIRGKLADAIYSDGDQSIEQAVFDLLKLRGKTMAAAESCTGGMLGQRITALPGSSAIFNGGVVAYHNDIKQNVLGVGADLLAEKGAVSAEVACAMAAGVMKLCRADYGVAITGVAGPGGGSPEKPVGLVYIAVADAQQTNWQECRLGGGRETVREASVLLALDLLRRRV